MVIVDTSVVYKWLVDEPPMSQAFQARDLLKKFLKGEEKVSAPDILLYELANIFSYKTHLSKKDVKRVWKRFASFDVSLIHPSNDFISLCIDFSKKHAVSVYDASFAVLAYKEKCNLVSADKRFIRDVNLPFVKSLDSY